MNRPRDEFERTLYGDDASRVLQLEPVWHVLGLAVTAYVIAAALGIIIQHVHRIGAEPNAAILVGGVLVTAGSGLLAGAALLGAEQLVRRGCRRWSSGS